MIPRFRTRFLLIPGAIDVIRNCVGPLACGPVPTDLNEPMDGSFTAVLHFWIEWWVIVVLSFRLTQWHASFWVVQELLSYGAGLQWIDLTEASVRTDTSLLLGYPCVMLTKITQ